jgi:aryl-alcohol dehydrogenase-like predicted oxidoreductase
MPFCSWSSHARRKCSSARSSQPHAAASTPRTRDPEAEILPLVRKLGIGFVAYSPLGRGFLTGRLRSMDRLDVGDFRRNNPRFVEGNLEQNLRIVDQVEAVARLEENAAADGLELSADQLARLGAIPSPVGDRYADMTPVNR